MVYRKPSRGPVSLEKELKSLWARSQIQLYSLILLLLLVFAFFYLKVGLKAACESVSARLEEVEEPLAREMALGSHDSAATILEALNAKLAAHEPGGTLRLVPGAPEAVGSTALQCRAGFFSISVEWPLYFADRQLGRIEGDMEVYSFPLFCLAVLLVLATIFWIQRTLNQSFHRKVHESILGPVRQLSQGKSLDGLERYPEEVSVISANFQKLSQAIRESEKNAAELEKEREFSQLARQIAHDIRSPLAALRTMLKLASGFPDDQKNLLTGAVNRIGDIANRLLAESKRHLDPIRETEFSDESLYSLLDPIVSEKRAQYLGAPVTLSFYVEADAFCLFARIQPGDFKRALSNLVDNAVEACTGPGQVTIGLGQEEDWAVVTVRDNGRGIPTSLLDVVGQRGFSFGKANGNGLGLFFAKSVIESWGGSVGIRSEIDRGTEVSVRLRKGSPPACVVTELSLDPGAEVIVADDDISIHRIWETRFRDLGPGLTVRHLHSPSELERYASQPKSGAGPRTFLVDYELGPDCPTGLETIVSLGLARESILVTSHADEPELRKACFDRGIRIMPKAISGYVPITLSPPEVV